MLYLDYPQAWAWTFQDPATPTMFGLIDLHDRIIFYLIIILLVVSWFMISAFFSKDHMVYEAHGNLIEFIWTLSPALILWAIGLPSLKLLYVMDEIMDAEVTIKAVGHQWYWSYEYTDYVDQG